MPTTPQSCVLVTGSRHYRDYDTLARLLEPFSPDLLIEGNAPGADAIARTWQQDRGGAVLTWPDNHWGGPAELTGPMRNQCMVNVAAALADAGWRVDVVAFPLADSRGTWSCVSLARAAGLPIHIAEHR